MDTVDKYLSSSVVSVSSGSFVPTLSTIFSVPGFVS